MGPTFGGGGEVGCGESGNEPAQQPAAEDSVAKTPPPEPAALKKPEEKPLRTIQPTPLTPPNLLSNTGSKKPDFNGDGMVNFEDFFLFADVFNSEDLRFDLDGDGRVGFSDFFGQSTR